MTTGRINQVSNAVRPGAGNPVKGPTAPERCTSQPPRRRVSLRQMNREVELASRW
jgi:hypothetical protein